MDIRVMIVDPLAREFLDYNNTIASKSDLST